MNTLNTSLLQSTTQVLEKYYGQGVSEIMINRPGEVWIDQSGNLLRFTDEDLTPHMIDKMVRTIGGHAGSPVTTNNPLLSATLPTRLDEETGAIKGGERIQVVYDPVVRKNHTSISLRIPNRQQFTMEQYKEFGMFESIGAVQPDTRLQKLYEAKNWFEFISEAVKSKLTIILSGGTSTGKTTFANTLTSLMGDDERIITIEDAYEIMAKQANQVNLLTVAAKSDSDGKQIREAVTTRDLIAAALRMRPDRIIKGELRGAEAFDFLRAVNTGHPGSVTTLHADTTAGALNALAQLVMQANTGWSGTDIRTYIEASVDVVIQLKRSGDRRYVSDIWWKNAA
jgi:type IV secretion system protein VirB11